MSVQRRSSKWLVFSISALVVGVALLLTPLGVSAQGGGVPESSGCSSVTESSCCTCHAQTHPVLITTEWHAIHARQDCCWNCHGGNNRAQDKDQAHAGMVSNPLDDIYLSCHQCHPNDYQQRADRFAVALGVTPQSSAPISVAVAIQPPRTEPLSQPPMTNLPSRRLDNTLWLMALVVSVAALLTSLIVMWRKLAR
jgi:hypothetical protein